MAGHLNINQFFFFFQFAQTMVIIEHQFTGKAIIYVKILAPNLSHVLCTYNNPIESMTDQPVKYDMNIFQSYCPL